jgi:hypothetical protein
MAERRAVRRRPDYDESAEQAEAAEPESDGERERSAGRSRSARRRRDAGLTAAEVAQEGMRQIAELTGKEPEGVTGVEPADEEGWVVGVELVEDRRIPSSTDILATYEVEIDAGGELVSYHRVKRYARGRGDNKDS